MEYEEIRIELFFKKVKILDFSLPAPPVASSEAEIHPKGTFLAGEEGVLNIHFRSNPEPIEIVW